MRQLVTSACLCLAFVSSNLYAQQEEPKQPEVVRLDQSFDRIVDAASSPVKADDISKLTKEIRSHADIYRRVGHGNALIYAFSAFVEGSVADDLARTREFFGRRDLTKEIIALHRTTLDALEMSVENTPVYYVVYGAKRGTNAQTQGVGGANDGQSFVYLNLVALAQAKHWEAAVIHETVHTIQNPAEPSLLSRSILEAVPTYISQALHEDVSDADAMFWPPEKWKAAEERREEIVQAFAELRNETDEKRVKQFLLLHVPLQTVPGAPDRTGYYVGYLAVKAWVQQNPDRPLKDLLRVDPQEFWEALVRQEK